MQDKSLKWVISVTPVQWSHKKNVLLDDGMNNIHNQRRWFTAIVHKLELENVYDEIVQGELLQVSEGVLCLTAVSEEFKGCQLLAC